ncbi:MAG: 2-C-methyl-D-erythritol 4-phosphate cytidylyltransferase [Rhodobacteraceae bacterium]|nr:2-C-methyl-D-erythritol 4-phosphate cytidylyltransferase [Paracoccaceae bacterium]
MNIAAIVVAAGASTRAGGGVPKPYRNLGGEPVLAHAIRSLLQHERIGTLRVVIGAGHEAYFETVASAMNDDRLSSPVFGGATRGESVLAGLESVEAEHVIVHDGARPFPDLSATEILLDKLQRYDAVFLALPVHDTLCYIDSDGTIARGPDRQNLWRAQTPQGFRRNAILRAYRAVGTSETDDISVARAAGVHAVAVPGSEANLKITVPEDFKVAARILGQDSTSSGKDALQSDKSGLPGPRDVDERGERRNQPTDRSARKDEE